MTGNGMFFQNRQAEEAGPKAARQGVIYARYSSDMQDTSDSIEVQVSECQKYAVANSIAIVREPFVDKAETGTATENRKSYQRLLSLAQGRDRNFDVILTFHTSRWGRGIESEIDEYLLEKNGVKIIAVSQPFTADDAIESVFMKGILRKIDAYYSMQASKYTHAYQTSNAQNGFKNGGMAPDGYAMEPVPTGKKDKHGKEKMKSRLALDKKPGKYDLSDQSRQKMIEFAFVNALKGKGIRWLSHEIYHLGWRARNSNERISAGTIRMWLINPTYTGFMVWNRTKFFRKNGKRVYRHNPISKWVFSSEPAHPPIISKETFEVVAQKFMWRSDRCQGRPAHTSRGDYYTASPRYLMSGLLDCGLCGAKYIAGVNKHRDKSAQVYMICNTKQRFGKKKCPNANISLSVAEGAVMDKLLNNLLTEKEIKQFIAAFNEFSERTSGRAGDEAALLLKEKARIERELANLKHAVMQGADPRTFVKELQERQVALDGLQARLALLKDSGATPKLLYDPKKLGMWLANLRAMVFKADFDLRRELVRRFVKKIVVEPDKTAKMTWDLPAVVSLFGGQEVPAETLDLKVMTKIGCGGWI